jgi:chitodextrinase
MKYARSACGVGLAMLLAVLLPITAGQARDFTTTVYDPWTASSRTGQDSIWQRAVSGNWQNVHGIPHASMTTNDATVPADAVTDLTTTDSSSDPTADVPLAFVAQMSGDTTAPSIPSAVIAAVNSSSQISVMWNGSTDTGGSGVAGYKVYRSGTLVGTTTATSYVDSGLSPNTQYCYAIIAYDNAGNSSTASAQACVTTPPAITVPSIPSAVIATVNSSSQISVMWNASTDTGGSGLAGYKIYRSGTLVGTTTATSYVDGGLSPNTQYCYTVAAYDNAGNNSTASAQACVTTALATVPNMPPDEFNGPFASWANLKANYGATGNGVADDTSALQAALNDLGTNGDASVLYIPAGTYLITSTVTLQSRQHVSIIGADPSTTTLVWGGASGGVLLHLDGVAYGRYDRLTFNGQGTVGVLIDQSLTGYGQGQYFDSGNEYADDVFENAGFGIRGGNYDLGAAESSVLRCQFLGNSGAGIILKNYNALDWFVWESTFSNNYDGVSNTPGAGYFHVIGCLFERSANADIDIGDMGIFSARCNTSIGSAQFLTTEFAWANGGQITIQGNTIANTISNIAINIGTMGPILLIDNVIAGSSSATGPAVVQNSYNSADMVAVGNTFTVNNPLSVTGGTPSVVNVNNQTVSLNSLTITNPVLPGVLPNNHRTVFDVPVGSDASAIQSAINHAAVLSGQRPVVHLPQGNYAITQTLVVPANSDVQIIGDGGTSLLYWNGAPGTNAVLQLAGPSRAILRDFGILGSGNSAGIEVDNTDQSGSRVYMEQAHLTRGEIANLLVDQLDNTLVELHDFYPSQTAVAPATTGIGLQVIGGPSAASGNPLGGQTVVYAGASSGNYVSFGVSDGGRLLVDDMWYEGPNISTFASVSDRSVVTADNCRMALPSGGGYTAQIENLSGLVSILNSQPDQPVGIFGSGTGTVWVVGNESHGPSSNYFTNATTSTVGVFTGNRWYDLSDGSDDVADQGVATASLALQMLAQLRSGKPLSQPTVLPVGITDLRLYRVFIDSTATTDIHLSR